MDVVFVPTASTTPPTVTSVTPANNSSGVSPSAVVTATFSEPMNASTINGTTFLLVDSSNNPVPGTVTYNASNATATLTPNAALTRPPTYTATVKERGERSQGFQWQCAGRGFYLVIHHRGRYHATDGDLGQPLAGATGVAATTAVNAVFSEPVNPTTVNRSTFQLFGPGNSLVAATVTYTSGSKTATLQPNAALASSTTYTAVVTGGSNGVKDLAGNALASNFTWSFTTAAVVAGKLSMQRLERVDHSRTMSIVLTTTPLKWASASAPTGRNDYERAVLQERCQHRNAHAHLWTNTGTLLGTATFTGESASGWQQVDFATPVPISANTTYVASYFAPNGHYSADNSYFLNSVDQFAPDCLAGWFRRSRRGIQLRIKQCVPGFHFLVQQLLGGRSVCSDREYYTADRDFGNAGQ